ncbi:MAG: hypothetical protein WBB15_02630 [Ornithinimicrobium sp.]
MKRTAVIALAAMTLAVGGCTTSDPTPPGSLGALAEAEEGDEPEGIPGEGEGPDGEGSEDSEEEDPVDEGGAEGEGEEPAHSERLPDASEMTDEVCIAFFNGAAPLAGLTQDALALVERGSNSGLTQLEYQEIDVLAQRLDELGALGDDEQAEAIEIINAPFTAVQRAGSGNGGQGSNSDEVTYDAIDTEESEQAQESFTEACTFDE